MAKHCPFCGKFMEAGDWYRDETGQWIRWWSCTSKSPCPGLVPEYDE